MKNTSKSKWIDGGTEALSLIDNRRFWPLLLDKRNNASEKFELAKINDFQLGEAAKIDQDIMALYLDAAFEYDGITRTFTSRGGDLHDAVLSINDSKKKHGRISFGLSVVAGLIAGLAVVFIVEIFKDDFFAYFNI